MKNEDEYYVDWVHHDSITKANYNLEPFTVQDLQPNRVYICGRDVTDYKTWKEFEQIVTDQAEQLRSLEEQVKIIDNFKENYGYTNYDTEEMLEDLQSRVFQAEDDTKIIEDLLAHFEIYDENEILDKVKSLEEQLKNAIVPKFKSNDVAWRIHWYTKEIERVVIVNTRIEIILSPKICYTIAILEGNDTLANLDSKYFENINSYIDQVKESELFATREDAEKRLTELEGK